MKEKRYLLIGMLLGILISWALVFFTLPFILRKFSFLLGFIACLAFVSLGLILLFVWDKKSFLLGLFGKSPTTKDAGLANRSYVLIRMLAVVFIVMGALATTYVIFKQDELYKAQMQFQNKRIEHQSALLESVRNSDLVYLMSNILDKVDDELKDNPKRILSDETIARIAALSYSFKPYAYWEGDNLSKKKLSPERGQLLISLSKMNIDSSSFDKIKFKTVFSEADLRGADLRKANLKGANLKNANLKDADLRGADLTTADLRGANLWGANLGNANLSASDLRRADLKWAEFRGANLKKAILEGADLTSAKLAKMDFDGAFLNWAFLNKADLKKVNLAGVELSGTALRRANMSDADLSRAALKWVDFREANLSRTNFSHAKFNAADLSGSDLTDADLTDADLYKITVKEKNWFEKLAKWRVKGIKKIQEKYKIVEDEFGVANYRLMPIEN